jgi:hypothetical protein
VPGPPGGRLRRYAKVPLALSFGLGLVVFALEVADKVRTGHFADLLPSLAGRNASYLALIVLVLLAPVLIAVAVAVSWWRGRHERDFERKYLKKPPGA